MEDRESIQKLEDLVTSRVDDQTLGPEDLARESFTSLSNLYRKLKRIVGHTASGFIEQRRLEEAKRLFSESPDLGIGQISEQVGYKDQAYFTSAFDYPKLP